MKIWSQEAYSPHVRLNIQNIGKHHLHVWKQAAARQPHHNDETLNKMCTHASAKKNIIFRWGIKPKSKTKHNFVNFVRIETWQMYLS